LRYFGKVFTGKNRKYTDLLFYVKSKVLPISSPFMSIWSHGFIIDVSEMEKTEPDLLRKKKLIVCQALKPHEEPSYYFIE
jgi:hypothetical protein